MAFTDEYEFQNNVNRLALSQEFALQYGVAADEIMAILAAQSAKTPKAPVTPPIVTPKAPPFKAVPKNVRPVVKGGIQINRPGANLISLTRPGSKPSTNNTNLARPGTSTKSTAVQSTRATSTNTVRMPTTTIRRSDRRLKTDIQLIGQSPSGINMYEFRFIADPSKKYQGVLADELLGTPFENAVSIDNDGYYVVDYDKIDVTFKEVAEA